MNIATGLTTRVFNKCEAEVSSKGTKLGWFFGYLILTLLLIFHICIYNYVTKLDARDLTIIIHQQNGTLYEKGVYFITEVAESS
jgi:hypothetical protein